MDTSLSDRLEAAVLLLAGDGTLKDRLASAFREHLDDIDELELPGEVQSRVCPDVQDHAPGARVAGDNVVRASVRKLSNEEALRFSALIVHMHALRMKSLIAGTKLPARIGATPRATTSLVSLLTIEGGSSGAARSGLANSP